MAAVLQILSSTQVAPAATDTTVYTVPTGKSVKVATFALHNPTNIPTTINASILPSGATVDGTHRLLTNFVLNAYETISQEDVLRFAKGAFLEAGAFVSVRSSFAASLNVIITGAVIS